MVRETRPANGDPNTVNPRNRGATAADYAPMVEHVKRLRASNDDKRWAELYAVTRIPIDTLAQQQALVQGVFGGDGTAYKNFIAEVNNIGQAESNATPEAATYNMAWSVRKRLTDAGNKSWPALDQQAAREEERAKRFGMKWPPA